MKEVLKYTLIWAATSLGLISTGLFLDHDINFWCRLFFAGVALMTVYIPATLYFFRLFKKDN